MMTAKKNKEDTVTISKEDYDKLLDERMWLIAIRDAGVDNWSGYEYAYDAYFEMKKENGKEKED